MPTAAYFSGCAIEKVFRAIGGIQILIESPVIQELIAKTVQNGIVLVLEARFDKVPAPLINRLREIQDDERLSQLNRFAVQCSSLDSFRDRLN